MMLTMKSIGDLDDKTLLSKLEEVRGQLFEMKMKKATTGVDKTHKKGELKKDIARLLTAYTMRKGK